LQRKIWKDEYERLKKKEEAIALYVSFARLLANV
jgi:hypothetical protein